MNGPVLHLGHDHCLTFTAWRPDRALNPQFVAEPDVDRWGAIIDHPRPDGTGTCRSGVTFDGEAQRRIIDDGRALWQVQVWEPLTLTPSVRCGTCGDHGNVTGGRWIPA